MYRCDRFLANSLFDRGQACGQLFQMLRPPGFDWFTQILLETFAKIPQSAYRYQFTATGRRVLNETLQHSRILSQAIDILYERNRAL